MLLTQTLSGSQRLCGFLGYCNSSCFVSICVAITSWKQHVLGTAASKHSIPRILGSFIYAWTFCDFWVSSCEQRSCACCVNSIKYLADTRPQALFLSLVSDISAVLLFFWGYALLFCLRHSVNTRVTAVWVWDRLARQLPRFFADAAPICASWRALESTIILYKCSPTLFWRWSTYGPKLLKLITRW